MTPRIRTYTIATCVFVAAAALMFAFTTRTSHQLVETSLSSITEGSLYQTRVQPIFTARCIACHSCNLAPCQLNLTTYDGAIRGANKTPINQPRAQSPWPQTRLGIDAQTEEGWRALKFYSVTQSDENNFNLLHAALDLKNQTPTGAIAIHAEDNKMCPADRKEWDSFSHSHAEMGMPYGLPPLARTQLDTIEEWLAAGTPGPMADEHRRLTSPTTSSGRAIVAATEAYLNRESLPARLVSRYLYEHLFLAHLHFQTEMPNEFYRLTRSRTQCSVGVDEIASRRPSDAPGVDNFRYCLRKVDQAITEKNHIVYEMGQARLERWQKIFYAKPWAVSQLPSYDEKRSSNPFITFRELPAEARYRWLLDDAQYTVMTFIKGAVCRGDTAVNVIDEQFQILFLDPSTDHFAQDAAYADRVSPSLRLPAYYGSNVKFINLSKNLVPIRMAELKSQRNDYRRSRDIELSLTRPNGYALTDIWNGDRQNPNAILSVFRHFDSAQVLKGAWGAEPKTYWVLDYPLMERIVYNLVVGFDNNGSMGHQLLTRVYMHYIRMEAEENFLSFLPPEVRAPLRASWYRDTADVNKRYPLNPGTGVRSPTAVAYSSKVDAQNPDFWPLLKHEFFNQLTQTRLNQKVLGERDLINPAPLDGEIASSIASAQEFEHELRKLVSRPASVAPFSNYLDDTAIIHLVVDGGSRDRMYTVIRNKEHFNIANILGERGRHDYANDSIAVVPGYQASYPNRFFMVSLQTAPSFLRELKSIHRQADIRDLLARYGISRQDPNFWRHYDWFVSAMAKSDPVGAGAIDLMRYGNAEPLPEDDENTAL